MEPGRPYQAFVENEARKYWQETMKIGSLTNPLTTGNPDSSYADPLSGTVPLTQWYSTPWNEVG